MIDPRTMSSVLAVSRSPAHSFSKAPELFIRLVAGLGVEGDAHCGERVKHRSRVRVDPAQPNLRQVHLIHAELLDELRDQGFRVDPGSLGENITTAGVDLLTLPRGTLLRIGPTAIVKVTGLRNPCKQLDEYERGLMQAVLARGPSGELIRKCGIMSIVEVGGDVRPGDRIVVSLPDGPHHPMVPV